IAPLLDKQLIDKMYLQLAPVLLGEGIPLFTQKEGKQLFDLIEVKKYGQFAELVLEKHHH
ncbi:dihydrofolate reductase, partial [Escherichia coli]|nr:dihydrofolate reductase [Escherichia coli]